MTRMVTVRLDRFGRDALDAYVQAGRGTLSSLVQTAVTYYLSDGGSGRPAWAVPAMAREADSGDPLDVELGDDLHERLEREAGRQGVDLGPLARHALLYFLADVDSGRAAIDRQSEAR
jgi:hypothetical protein